MSETYLDNAATTKPLNSVLEEMHPYLTEKWYNPSSLNKRSVEVKKQIEAARKTVADFISANQDEVFFTSGGSESNCWAIRGWIDAHLRNGRTKLVVITSPIEHKSIMAMHDSAASCLAFFVTVRVDKAGNVDADDLEAKMAHYQKEGFKILVSIQAANNEIGTYQKIGKLSHIVHSYDGTFHVDAVQAFGHIPLHVDAMNIDMLSASGHKIGAPKGIGILYKKKSVELEPLIYGTQMDGLRGGTENVAYIIAMAKATEAIEKIAKETNWHLEIEYTRSDAVAKLEKIGCTLVGSRTNRLPNNICVMLPKGVGAEEMMYLLETSDIIVSTGSACNSYSKEPSHVLKAIGLTDEEASRCLRITLPTRIASGTIDKVIYEIERLTRLF